MIALTLQFVGILTIIVFIIFLLFLLGGHLERVLRHIHFPLRRAANNPILSPHALNDWEDHSVFNPATVVDDNGIIHLLYRAMGQGGLSKIGHAESKDGVHFTRRFGFPVYHKRHDSPFDTRSNEEKRFNPAKYTSGGGWGGCEDPRAVRIEDEIFMSYTAFEGWHSVRIALTSIKLDDFKAGKWNWRRPLLLSAAGSIEKNWVLFPEKIGGKFAVLHSVSPEIKIDYVENFDTFNDETTFITSQNSPTTGGRQEHWDNLMRGAAAPPMKTDEGWLLLYHAMDRNDPDKYKLGAMLLDLDDPTKIIARSPGPILAPDMHYENDWKPGVIYASGAAIIGDTLHVYYGGGDKYICAATASVSALLDWLLRYGKE